jgi:hypothetical protein
VIDFGARRDAVTLPRVHRLIGCPVVGDRLWKLAATIQAARVARPLLATSPRREWRDPSRPELELRY